MDGSLVLTPGTGRRRLPRLASLLARGGRRGWRLGLLCLHLLLSLPIALVLHWRLRRGRLEFQQAAGIMAWWCRRMLRILRIRLELHGQPLGAAHLAVANHVSYLDILCLAAVRPLRFLSKAEVAQWPLFGWFARLMRTLFIERERAHDSLRAIDAVAQALAAGDAVLCFPEGTTTRGGQVRPFHAALFEAGLRTGCPVQPIAIHYASPRDRSRPHPRAAFVGDDTLLPHLWRLLAEPHIVAQLHYGEALPPHGTRRELAKRAHAAVSAALPPA